MAIYLLAIATSRGRERPVSRSVSSYSPRVSRVRSARAVPRALPLSSGGIRSVRHHARVIDSVPRSSRRATAADSPAIADRTRQRRSPATDSERGAIGRATRARTRTGFGGGRPWTAVVHGRRRATVARGTAEDCSRRWTRDYRTQRTTARGGWISVVRASCGLSLAKKLDSNRPRLSADLASSRGRSRGIPPVGVRPSLRPRRQLSHGGGYSGRCGPLWYLSDRPSGRVWSAASRAPQGRVVHTHS